jgi:hypothetical protein
MLVMKNLVELCLVNAIHVSDVVNGIKLHMFQVVMSLCHHDEYLLDHGFFFVGKMK